MKTTENEFKINNNYMLIELLESKRGQDRTVFNSFSSPCGSYRCLLGDYLFDDFVDENGVFEHVLFEKHCLSFSTDDEFGFGGDGKGSIYDFTHYEWAKVFGGAINGSIDNRIAAVKGHIARLESENN